LWRHPDAPEYRDTQFRNPFGFWAVVGFAALLAVVIVLGRAVGESFGGTGAIVGAVAVGLADVDSVTVSLTRLTPEPLTAESAAFAFLAPLPAIPSARSPSAWLSAAAASPFSLR
jgi:uncharacterized membrane protein (DUF4010 family)